MMSNREREVYDLVVQGITNKEIGVLLGITEKTVKANVTAIFKKNGVTSRPELIVKHYQQDALRYRWLRKQGWTAGGLVVTHLSNVALGADCPTGDRLDAAVEEMMNDCTETNGVSAHGESEEATQPV